MKMNKWIGSFFLVGFLVLSGAFYIQASEHISALEAAKNEDSPIEVKNYGDEEESEYSFRLKRTQNTSCTWNDESGIADPQLFHQTGEGIERWGQMVTSDEQKGKISCYLTNMGSYKGKNTNLKITFMDWPSYEDKTGKRYYPLLGVALQMDKDIYALTFADIWYEAKMEILDDQGRPLAVNMTYRADDLDYGQIFGVKKSDKIDGLAIPEDSRVYYTEQDGFDYFYADNIDSQEYDKDSVQVQYGNISAFTLRVGGGVALPGTFNYEKYATDKLQKDYEKIRKYLIGESSVETSTQAGAVLGWIAGSAKGYGPFTAPVPVKSADHSEVHGEEEFQYFINFKIPECQPADYYKSLVLTDPIPDALKVNKVTVYDADNQNDVSRKFHIQITQGTVDHVRVSAVDTSSAWLYGRSFEVRIQVQKRKEYIFGTSNIISNKAALCVDQKTTKETQPVTTSFYYQITTKVENGTITQSNMKVPAGSSVKINYSPFKGYDLRTIKVDQLEVSKNEHLSEYLFSKVNSDHSIEVIYGKNAVITITKEVTGKWDKFGTPIFLFQISGTDYNGLKHTYYETLEIQEHFDEDEIYHKTFSMEIPAGLWEVKEIPVSRYTFTGIKDVVNGTIDGKTLMLDMINHNTAKATFCNKMTNYREFSHNDLEINVFGK